MCQNVPRCDFSAVNLFRTQPDCQTSPAFFRFPLLFFPWTERHELKSLSSKGNFFLNGDGLKRLFLTLDVDSLLSLVLLLSLSLSFCLTLFHLELQMNNMQCSLNCSAYPLLHLSPCLLVLMHISWPKSSATVKLEVRALFLGLHLDSVYTHKCTKVSGNQNSSTVSKI